LNATAVGTEILKNLVLPGFGSFTIIDGKVTSGADIGNNFFLDKSAFGLPRGRVVMELLKEMNEDVAGDFVEADPSVLIEKNSDVFSQFSIIIATDLPERSVLKLGEICWNLNTPLVIARCYGLFGYIRVVVPEHTVVETHPDNPIDDLRLDAPLPELQELANAVDLSTLDSEQRAHVPYLLLLLKAKHIWKQTHTELPKNSAEKDQFKDILRGMGQEDSQNIAEAIANAHKAWLKTTIPGDVQDIFEDPACKKIDSKSSNFWILARAVSDFVNSPEEGNRFLPLQGAIPDMHSDTKSYTTIQQIYQNKTRSDIAAISARVHNLLISVNRAPDSIPPEDIKTFCKNAGRLALLRYRSLKDEHENPKGSFIGNRLEDQEDNLKIYVLLRAVCHFEEQHKRLPGIHDEDVEGDIPLLKKSVLAVISALGINNNSIKDEIIHEMCRFGASELHNIAAFIGGVASQEVIKLITHQFVPINNTFIFNGIHSSCLTETL